MVGAVRFELVFLTFTKAVLRKIDWHFHKFLVSMTRQCFQSDMFAFNS
jgi:hypothetical protein